MSCGGVHITVSAIREPEIRKRNVTERLLELNWEKGCDAASSPDTVALFDTDPKNQPGKD